MHASCRERLFLQSCAAKHAQPAPFVGEKRTNNCVVSDPARPVRCCGACAPKRAIISVSHSMSQSFQNPLNRSGAISV
jgi:hypothetical protein